MFDHEIRWYTLVALALLTGLAHLASETSGLWFAFPARPDWLWGLAFFAVLRTPPVSALAAFAACGVVRDALLGPRLGSAAIAYILVGWLVLSWRHLGGRHGILTSVLLAGVTAFLAALIRHSLDYGWLAHRLVDRIFFVSIGDGLLTGVGYLPLMLVLSAASFRPWRERSGF
jgi:rod shape-determining protein MreD